MDSIENLAAEQRLGRVIQVARKHAGLTQQALCQRSGLSYSTLAKIERGAIKTPSVFTIRDIAATLNISLDDLLRDVVVKPSLNTPLAPAITKKTSKNGVKFVYFDMNECLVRFGSRGFTLLAEESGESVDEIETIFWNYDADVCRGATSIDELNTTLAMRLGMMVDWKKYYLSAVESMPGMDVLLEWVSQNYNTGIISNAMPGFIQSLLENGKLPAIAYDTIIDSSVVHSLKPEPAIYETALAQAAVKPEQILLVDDNRANLAAASRLGWKTIWFDSFHPEESIVNISTALQPQD